MSGIAGILHLDGAPVEPARIQRMNDALAGRGPDAQGRWTGKSIGLGHRAFWTTPEATSESQPHQDARPRWRSPSMAVSTTATN
jgi:asparagine synthase (glutamine-hydrolysing)